MKNVSKFCALAFVAVFVSACGESFSPRDVCYDKAIAMVKKKTRSKSVDDVSMMDIKSVEGASADEIASGLKKMMNEAPYDKVIHPIRNVYKKIKNVNPDVTQGLFGVFQATTGDKKKTFVAGCLAWQDANERTHVKVNVKELR